MARARVSPRKQSQKVKPRKSHPEPRNVLHEKWGKMEHCNPLITALRELEDWPKDFLEFREADEGDPAACWRETLLALAVARKAYTQLEAISSNLWSREERERRFLEKNYAQALLDDALEAARATVEKTQRFFDTFNSPEERIGYGM